MSHHRTCCCPKWNLVHKFDADGVLLWSIWPAFVPLGQIACRMLLLVGGRLIAYVAADPVGWIFEVDTSTGEVGVWRATPAYVDLFSDGTYLYGARKTMPGGGDFDVLDRLSLTTFEQLASASWPSQSFSGGFGFPVYHQVADGLAVVPDFNLSGGGGGNSHLKRLVLADFPPALDTGAIGYGSGPLASFVRDAGAGIWQAPLARYEFVTVDGVYASFQADTWSTAGPAFWGVLVSADYVFAFSQTVLRRAPRSGSGPQLVTPILVLPATAEMGRAPWSSAITADGSRLALAVSVPDASVDPLQVINPDGEVLWSVRWPAQRLRPGTDRLTECVAMTDAGIVFAGTIPTNTQALEVDG